LGADYISTFYVYELGKAYLLLGELIEAFERALANVALAKSAGGELAHMSLWNAILYQPWTGGKVWK
jgi:hypothetical protein